jgi:DNA primase
VDEGLHGTSPLIRGGKTLTSSSDIFAQVRAGIDIVDLIGQHVALRRAGREFKGLCPFHDDHRPSMAVVPSKQIFHCFVCGTGGDAFKFMELFHKMGRGEALRALAQRAGIQLPDLPRASDNGDGPSAREQIAGANAWACDFFCAALRSPAGKAAIDYLHSRGLTDDTIDRFRLGFAPDSWTALSTAALRAQIPSCHLVAAGLAKTRSDGSPYDLFRNRVLFPITAGDRIIGFGGRVLAERRDEAGNVIEAKYLNTPETPLFDKSATLFALPFARQEIVRSGIAVIVEGYMDVIACHQAGITNVVATLGTALTPAHVRALRHLARTLVLVFDSDDAGARAADRAMDVLVHSPLDVRIAAVPSGKDPCEFILSQGEAGRDAFRKLIAQSRDALDFKWRGLMAKFNGVESIAGRQEALAEFLRFLSSSLRSGAVDPLRRGLILSRLAPLCGLSIQELRAATDQLSSPRPSGPGEKAEASPPSPSFDPAAITGAPAAEAWIIGALLFDPSLYADFRDELELSLFPAFSPLAAASFEYLEGFADAGDASLAGFLSYAGELPDGQQLVHQAVCFEERFADWIEPAHFSPKIGELVQRLRLDRQVTRVSMVRDCLKKLRPVKRREVA